MIIITNDNKDILKQAIKENQPLDSFDTSNVTDMSCMFISATSFNQPLDNLDTSKVTDMCCMFMDAEKFNQPLDNFDTSKVTKMGWMFCWAKSFNQPLDNFDTSKVTNMESMFKGAKSFNQPLDNFDTSKVTTMERMFVGATSMFIGYIMRFVAKAIFVYKKYDAMKFKYNLFSKSKEFDKYITTQLNNILYRRNNQSTIQSAIDGFIVD